MILGKARHDTTWIKVRKDSMPQRTGIPIGVVSKNDAGDRRTPVNAALNMLRLATKLASLALYTGVNGGGVGVWAHTYTNAKLSMNDKTAEAAPRPA